MSFFEGNLEQGFSSGNSNRDPFVIGNITFETGDLFSKKNIESSDLIVLPTSTTGSIQPGIAEKIKELGIQVPSPGVEADVLLLPAGHSQKFAWAYSFASKRPSNKRIIKSLCETLIKKATERNAKQVSLPLFGTGAGKLDPKEIAGVYTEVFNQQTHDIHFRVVIRNNKKFDEIKKSLTGNTIVEANEEIGFSKSIFTIRDKNEIDPVLNVKDVAQQMAEIINKLPDNEQEGMIGVFGKWGRGKTYLLKEIWKVLNDEKEKKFEKLDFHAWKYQDTPAVWSYLYETFADRFDELSTNWRDRVKRRFNLNSYRLKYWRIVWFLIPLLVSLAIAIIDFDDKLNIIYGLISLGLLSIVFAIYKNWNKGKMLIREYTQKVSFTHLLGNQAEIQKELKALLEIWSKKYKLTKVLLVVEDIDRCNEHKIIEVVDSLRVILEDADISKRLVILVSIDESILKKAIKLKYDKLIDAEKSDEKKKELNLLVNEYLDKLFILGIRLGELSIRERDEFFIALTKNDRDAFEIEAFEESFQKKKDSVVTVTPNAQGGKDIHVQIHEFVTATDEMSAKVVKDESIDRENSNNLKIAEKEFKILRECLRTHTPLTPRQIRIFYYRYILARNLLVTQYGKNGRKNIWRTESYYKIFIDQLISYSAENGRESLSRDKIKLMDEIKGSGSKFLFDGDQLPKEDHEELLKVLDIVIAY